MPRPRESILSDMSSNRTRVFVGCRFRNANQIEVVGRAIQLRWARGRSSQNQPSATHRPTHLVSPRNALSEAQAVRSNVLPPRNPSRRRPDP
jgi:hypothetical protein